MRSFIFLSHLIKYQPFPTCSYISVYVERDIPLCSELSEIEIELGEECEDEPSLQNADGQRDIVLEKLFSQIWLSMSVVKIHQ